MERTTVRRSPSARKRPEAGIVPHPASGRPRARVRNVRTWVAHSRVGARMTPLLRRGRREVYRLYGEDEFLREARPVHGVGGSDCVRPTRTQDIQEACLSNIREEKRPRLRSLAGMAMLASALAAVGWLLATSAGRSMRSNAQRRVKGPYGALAPAVSVARRPAGVSATRRTSGAGETAGRHARGHRAVRFRAGTRRARPRRATAQPVMSGPLPTTPPAVVDPVGRHEFGFEHGAGA